MNRNQVRHEAFVAIYTWIEEAHVVKAAHDWAWNCTPWPCGLPSDEHLEEGLKIALGVITVDWLTAECERQMIEASRKHAEDNA